MSLAGFMGGVGKLFSAGGKKTAQGFGAAGNSIKNTFGFTGAGTTAGNIAQIGGALTKTWDKVQQFAEKTGARFTHNIYVGVKGGPNSDIRRLWFLCLSAAFGRYRRRATGYQAADLFAVWDVTGKAVSVNITYSNNGIANAAAPVTGQMGPMELIQRGPSQLTIGGSWPEWMQRVTGTANGRSGALATPGDGGNSLANDQVVQIPTGNSLDNVGVTAGKLIPGSSLDNRTSGLGNVAGSASSGPSDGYRFFGIDREPVHNVDPLEYHKNVKHSVLREEADGNGTYRMQGGQEVTFTANSVPILPDAGRVITTGEKEDPRVQNPRPQVDGTSRSSLVTLVAAWLADPGQPVKAVPNSLVPYSVNKGLPANAATEFTPEPNKFPDGYAVGEYFKNLPWAFGG